MYNILYYDLENFDLDEVKVNNGFIKKIVTRNYIKKINCSSKGNIANKLL